MLAPLACPRCGEPALSLVQKAFRSPNRPYDCAVCGRAYVIQTPPHFWILYLLFLCLPAFIRSTWPWALGLLLAGLALAVFIVFRARLELYREPISFDA